MEPKDQFLCPSCKHHTLCYKELIENGRYIMKCAECDTQCVCENNGDVVPREQLIKESEDYA